MYSSYYKRHFTFFFFKDWSFDIEFRIPHGLPLQLWLKFCNNSTILILTFLTPLELERALDEVKASIIFAQPFLRGRRQLYWIVSEGSSGRTELAWNQKFEKSVMRWFCFWYIVWIFISSTVIDAFNSCPKQILSEY